MEYNLVYAGKIHDDFSRSQVRENLARRLRIEDPVKLDRIFSGKPCILKTRLSEADALRWLQAFLQDGAICELQSSTASVAKNSPPAPEQQSVKALPSTPQTPPDRDNSGAANNAPAKVPPARQGAFDAFAERTFSNLKGLNMGSFEEAMLRTSVFLPPRKKPNTEGPKKVVLQLAPVTDHSLESVPAPSPAPMLRKPVAPLTAYDHAGSFHEGELPEAAKGLCWGGLFAPYVWATFNGYQWSAVVPVALYLLQGVLPYWGLVFLLLHLPAGFFLLFKGRALSWQKLRWEGIGHFNSAQGHWAWGGLAYFVLMSVLMSGSAYVKARTEPYLLWENMALNRETTLLLRQEQADTRQSMPVEQPGLP